MTTGEPARGGPVDWARWTVIFLKPDCLARGLVGEVLAAVEAGAGVRVMTQRTVTVAEPQIIAHYADLIAARDLLNVDVLAELRRIYVGRQVMVALATGRNAAAQVRALLGHYDPAQADPASIRGRFGTDSLPQARAEGRLIDNLIHSSDTTADVPRDFAIWFGLGHYQALLAMPEAHLAADASSELAAHRHPS